MVASLRQRLIILFVVFLAILSSWGGRAFNYEPTYMRVLVLKDVNSANIKINGQYQILDQKNNIIYKGNNLNATLLGYEKGISIGEFNSSLNKVILRSLKQGIIKINGREFKGEIRVVKEKNTKHFIIVNYVELEEYVKGILYHEISHHWPMEAIRAQAIVSRTFAVYQRQVNKDKDFDVTADIYSQIYGGKTSERYRTNQAVSITKSQIITYKRAPFLTFFSACCAGHTEDASNLWDIDIQPLKGLKCGFCNDAPHFKWHVDLALKEIKQALNNKGLKITGAIRDITVVGRNASGRVTSLNIISGEKALKVSAKDFRQAIGPNVIRSTNFTVAINKDNAYFEGFGWGHGVGFCQWGGYFMAKQDRDYEEILQYYYPGTEIQTPNP